MNSLRTRAVAAVLAGSIAGCATFQPELAMSCRDPITGRYTTCGSGGGGGEGTLLLVGGIVLGAAAVAGIVYLVTRPSSPGAPPEPASPGTAADCALPAREVMVCESSRGYRFAIPAPGPCAVGARPIGAVPLTCAAIERPAWHACLHGGGWTPARSWESCASRGMADAPGDFLPEGRTSAQGVAPDATAPAAPVELELVEAPPSVDPRHLCDGPDGFAHVTSLTCAECGYAYHQGPAPLGVVVGDGAPRSRNVAPERVCVFRGRRVAVPYGHACRLHDPDAARGLLN